MANIYDLSCAYSITSEHYTSKNKTIVLTNGEPIDNFNGCKLITDNVIDDAFNIILEDVKKDYLVTIMVLGDDGINDHSWCEDSNNNLDDFLKWETEINDKYRGDNKLKKIFFSYFRYSNDKSYPNASKYAKEFATKYKINVSSGLTLVCFYQKNNDWVVSGTSIEPTFLSFKEKAEQYLDDWNKNKTEDDIQLYTPNDPHTDTLVNQQVTYDFGTSKGLYTQKYYYSDSKITDLLNKLKNNNVDYSCFSLYFGWQKEIQYYGSPSKLTPQGQLTSFKTILDFIKKYHYPMVLIYGGYRNIGTMCHNLAHYLYGDMQYPGPGPTNCFYIYYQDDGNTDKANDVKSFITQYGDIPTGYPWYMFYGFKKDGSLYVRYGSLYSQNLSGDISYKNSDIYIGKQFFDYTTIIDTQYNLFLELKKNVIVPKIDIKLYTPYPPKNGGSILEDANHALGHREECGFIVPPNGSQYKKMFTDDLNYSSLVYGWQTIATTLYHPTGNSSVHTSGILSSFQEVLKISNRNRRPLFLIYGDQNNIYTRIFNLGIDYWRRAYPTFFGNTSKCKVKDKQYKEDNTMYGFYYVYYQGYRYRGEYLQESEEVRNYITQYGDIPTGYPWYLVEGYKEDGTKYVRYGSLYSLSADPVSYSEDIFGYQQPNYDFSKDTELSNIYLRFGDLVKELGTDINYIYDNEVEVPNYSVTFRDYDKSILFIECVEENGSSYYSEIPYREGYNFTGWNPQPVNVTCDLSCDAQYSIKTFDVTFMKGDIILKKTQKVNYNEDAIPPEIDPEEGTKIFNGYYPDYHNVINDLTCYAQFIDKSINIKQEAFMNCKSLNSVNFKALSCIEDKAFINCSSLTYAPLGTQIKDIGISSFYGCKNLSSIDMFNETNLNNSFNTVGEYAFAKSGIKKANLILNSTIADTYWGNHCFEDCDDLEEIDFKKSMFQAHYMFKNCKNLKKVSFNVPNGTAGNYVGKYMLENCTSLESISLPSCQYSFAEGFFKGCSNLKEVKFDTIYNCNFGYVGKYAFTNCNQLTSIEFPKSLDTLNNIEDTCLSGCPNLNNITFNGLNSDDFFKDNGFEDLYYGKFYQFTTYAGDKNGTYTYINNDEYCITNGIEKFDELYHLLSSNNIPYVIILDQYWVNNGQKEDVTLTGDISSASTTVTGRAYCEESISEGDPWLPFSEYFPVKFISYNDTFQDICKTKKAIFIRISDFIGAKIGSILTDNEIENKVTIAHDIRKKLIDDKSYDDFLLKIMNNYSHTFPKIWIDSLERISNHSFIYHWYYSSEETRWYARNTKGIKNNDKLNRIILKHISDCSEYEFCKNRYDCLNEKIIETGFFRLKHNCNIKFYNKTIKYTYDSSKYIEYIEPYSYPSDKETLTNFKIACDLAKEGKESVWYYNAKEIKEYADKHNIPVLIMYSSESCTPCQAYRKNVHENVEFQNWAKKQKFLLCRIEADSPKAADPELKYCMEDLKDNAFNFDKDGNGQVEGYNAFGAVDSSSKKLFYGWFKSNNYMPPAMTFYYKKDQTTISYFDYSFHELISIFKHEKLGIDKFIKCLKSLCLYHFDGNNKDDAKFVVDADPFYKDEYDIDVTNKFQIGPSLISPQNIYPELTSTNNLTKYISNKLKEYSYKDKSGEYLNGCYFEHTDWINDTYDSNAFYAAKYDESTKTHDTEPANAYFNKWAIQVGEKYYNLNLSNKDFKLASDTCGENPYIYRVLYNECEKPSTEYQLIIDCYDNDFETPKFLYSYNKYFTNLGLDQIISISTEFSYSKKIINIEFSNYSGTKPTVSYKSDDNENIIMNIKIYKDTIPKSGFTIKGTAYIKSYN